MDSILDIRLFDDRYRTGLIFSLFEGLLEGCQIKFVCDTNPSEYENYFQSAKLKNIDLNKSQNNDGTWNLSIKKNKKESSCCGICGGHD